MVEPTESAVAPPPTEPALGDRTDALDLSAYAPAPDAAPPRRRRAIYWVAVVAALAATAGGAALAATTYLEQTAPEHVVLDYLVALSRGDAATALAYGDVPDGDQDFLTAEVLAAQREIAPMSDPSVEVTTQTDSTASAVVEYELEFAAGPETVTDTIPLVRDGRTWRLAAVAVPVNISIDNARNRATIAGAAIPAGPQLFFPGALPVAFDTENLALSRYARVVRFAEEHDPAETAELTETGEAAVEEAIAAALAACLDGTAEVPTRCPSPPDGRGVPGSLRGKLSEPAANDTRIALQPGNDALVRVSGTVLITGEYDRLDYNNQRVPTTGRLIVDILVVCYATTPDTLIWRLA